MSERDPLSPGETFTAENGRTLRLDPSHRSGVRLESRTGYGAEHAADLGGEALRDWLERVDTRVELASRVLELFGGSFESADALVVGASEGGEVACLARRGARSIVGTDFGDAFANEGRIAARRVRVIGDSPGAGRATFRRDDITNSELPDDSFDLIVSWQTLEHISDPAAALREMKRLLRPGGLCFHEYNPFFALDGGHSPCTLDVPWGHARLSDADVERYLRRFRPGEADASLAFHRESLNRMSLADLRAHAEAAGLAIESLIPRTRTEDLMLLDRETLEDVRRLHPAADVIDLTSRIVRVVLRA